MVAVVAMFSVQYTVVFLKACNLLTLCRNIKCFYTHGNLCVRMKSIVILIALQACDHFTSLRQHHHR